MHEGVTELTGRERLLAAIGHHPYVLSRTADLDDLHAFVTGDAAVWVGHGPKGPTVGVFGAGEPAARLLVAVAAGGALPTGADLGSLRRVDLPRISREPLARHLPVAATQDWDFRWARRVPPRPGQQRVVPLTATDAPAIAALLDLAFPDAHTRPGDPRVRCWYGVRQGGTLVACGADRSRGGVGSVGALAVHPDWRGQGLGSALTSAMAATTLAEFPLVTLGVTTDNELASQLYQRLGFIEVTQRTSVHLQ